MKKPTKTRLDPLPDMAKFVRMAESHSCETASLIRADSVSSSSAETLTVSEKWEAFLHEREAVKVRELGEKAHNSRIQQAKEAIIQIIHSSTFSGSTEERINNYKLSLERKISKQMAVSAYDWELYGHLCFLFGDKSHRALQAAARAYKNSVDLEKKLRPALFLVEVTEELRRIEGQAAAPEIFLPQEEKREIDNQPYGKQPSAEEMRASKVRDAIKNGEHVGAFLQREVIGPSHRTLEFIGDKLGMHWTSLSYVRKGRHKLSPDMAAKLSHAFGPYSTQDLLTIQAAHDAKKADQAYSASFAKRAAPAGNQPHDEETRTSRVQDAIKNGEPVGSFLQRELIGPSEKTIEDIAHDIRVHRKSISQVKNGCYNLSPQMATKLSHYFGTYSTQDLLTIQAAHDAKKADQDFLIGLSKRNDLTPV